MSMSEEAKKIRREYLRQWRKNNPEKVKKHNSRSNTRYWEKKVAEITLKNNDK